MEPDLSVLEFLGLFLATSCAVAILVALYSAARQFIVYVKTRNEQAYHDWRIRKLTAACVANDAYQCADEHAPGWCRHCDAKSDADAALPPREATQEDAGVGLPPPLVDVEDEEDSDCVVVPRRRQRSRSPYETRSRHPARLRKRTQ